MRGLRGLCRSYLKKKGSQCRSFFRPTLDPCLCGCQLLLSACDTIQLYSDYLFSPIRNPFNVWQNDVKNAEAWLGCLEMSTWNLISIDRGSSGKDKNKKLQWRRQNLGFQLILVTWSSQTEKEQQGRHNGFLRTAILMRWA